MNRPVLIAILIFGYIGSLSAEENPRAEIKIGYTYHETFVRGSDGIIERDVPFLLLANHEQSKFYCQNTEYHDSLESTPSGRALSKQIRHAAINKYLESKDESAMESVVYKSFLYIFKSIQNNEMTVFDKAGLFDYGYYIEPLHSIEWVIGDSTKTILDYECVMASADYHGRYWTVWFTPEIPMPDGPWKLTGLPGLILEATESTGQHSFIANSIEISNQEIFPIYTPDKYDKMSRIDMLRIRHDTKCHSASMSAAATGIDFGKDHIMNDKESRIDFLETDYHK